VEVIGSTRQKMLVIWGKLLSTTDLQNMVHCIYYCLQLHLFIILMK